jgi:hypothetical protein
MNTRHAPNRCDPRAIRIAQVKFVALPMEEALPPVEMNPPPELFTILRTLIIRVIGRPQAARP